MTLNPLEVKIWARVLEYVKGATTPPCQIECLAVEPLTPVLVEVDTAFRPKFAI